MCVDKLTLFHEISPKQVRTILPINGGILTTLLIIIFINIGSTLCIAENNKSNITFPPRPRLAFNKDELQHLKTSPNKDKKRTQIISRADRILNNKIEIPKDVSGGQWIFYYACPNDGTRLQPLSKLKHKCKKCGKTYSNKRINAAYRTILYNKADREMYDLALAYAITGKSKYVTPLKEAFLELVDLYPKLQRHDRWDRTGLFAVVGGKRFCQHLSEAVSIIKLAKAYDLCANSPLFSKTERKLIEEQFLKRTVNEISNFELFIGGKNNHQTWFNAAYANVGVAIGNKKLIKRALNGTNGLLSQLKGSVTDDGIWYEGTVSYHFYALNAIIETLKPLQRSNIDLSDNKKLKSLWLGPLNLTFPNGTMPAINDGDPYDIKKANKAYQFALKYFKDPIFANIANKERDNNASYIPIKSCNLTDIGLAILKRGNGKNAITTFLDYGQHGEHHGHPDKLQIILYALNQELFLDPGRLSYSVKEYNSWARTTVAHNTVVMNQINQKPAKGKILFFEDNKKFSASFAECNSAYSGANMRRFILLTDTFMIDIFKVSKTPTLFSKTVTWDWLLHCRGKISSNQLSKPIKKSLGTTNGYQHLKKIQIVKNRSNLTSFDFHYRDKQFIRTFFPGENEKIYFGTGIGVTLNEKVPFILRRRKNPNEIFISLYDLTGNGDAIKNIKLKKIFNLDNSENKNAIGIVFNNSSGDKIKIAIDMDNNNKQLLFLGNKFNQISFSIEK